MTFRNFVILGTKTLGIQMDGAATLDQVANGSTQIGAGIVAGPATPLHASVVPFVANNRFPDLRVNGDAGISTAACSNHDAPNFRPAFASLAGGQMTPIQPPNDGFFDAVTFIGAVPPAPADNWMDGWTSFP